ncbi:MAG: exo-alpha-sialidase [Clostridia bacterium]|nr:exo-alpha-sialidase [Clostridia bacterium]
MILKYLKRAFSIALGILVVVVGFTSCKNTNEDDKSTDLSSSQISSTISSVSSSTTSELPPPPTTPEKEYPATDNGENIDMDSVENLKVCIVTPNKYSAWPMLGRVKDKLVCLYTVADQHSATEAGIYMKTSTTKGLSWTCGKEIFLDKTGVKGITGTGNDSEGNMLIWYRDGSPGAWQTTHELYKTDGHSVVLVSAPDFALRGGHIGNIFSFDGKLFAFYNTYGNTRSWGVLKSVDDGLTWEQIPIETDIPKAECPVEIDGFYAGDGKILALGRKDADEGTIAMFQIQSTDFGESWSKEYTNITDALGSSPSIIFDADTKDITLYFFARTIGQLKHREVNFIDVWNNPQNWSGSKVIISEKARGQDTGNVKTVAVDDIHFATYYAGSSTTTGVYGIIIKD